MAFESEDENVQCSEDENEDESLEHVQENDDDVDNMPLAVRWENFIKDLIWSEDRIFHPIKHPFIDQQSGKKYRSICRKFTYRSVQGIFHCRFCRYALHSNFHLSREKSTFFTQIWKIEEAFQNTFLETGIS